MQLVEQQRMLEQTPAPDEAEGEQTERVNVAGAGSRTGGVDDGHTVGEGLARQDRALLHIHHAIIPAGDDGEHLLSSSADCA